MFTGIVEALGRIIARQEHGGGLRLTIEEASVAKELKLGDSVAVNGCCLTAVSIDESSWCMDLVPETLSLTNLGDLHVGDVVNLELAVRANGRMGGHFVQGHVDGLGAISAKQALEDGSTLVSIRAPAELTQYMVHKGSITVDGISLTLTDVQTSEFSFAMIPHTAEVTTLGHKGVDATVHLEVDMLAKYVAKLCTPAL